MLNLTAHAPRPAAETIPKSLRAWYSWEMGPGGTRWHIRSLLTGLRYLPEAAKALFNPVLPVRYKLSL